MLLRARFAFTTAILSALAFSSFNPASAQKNDKDTAAKARATAIENLKKIKVDKPTVVETDNFIIVGTMPEAKAKALGTVLEKTLVLARKAAKYGDKETAWKGKLTVYFLPDIDDFKSFMRLVIIARAEGTYVNFRSEPAILVDAGELPGKPTDADLYANIAARMAGEHLKAKGTGTQVIPDWLRDGFGRITVWKATGSSKYNAYKTAARKAILYSGGKPPAIAETWSGERSPTSDILANSVAEFLAYGSKSVDFGKFLDGLKPADANARPTVMNGFMALGWKDEAAAEAAWKKWVQTGR